MSSTSLLEANDEWYAPFVYWVIHPDSSASDDDHNYCKNTAIQPSFLELNTSLKHYREMADGIIRKLSISHEVARRTEQVLFPHHDHDRCPESSVPSFLSCRLEEKITQSAMLLEQNSLILERLLRPFPVIVRHSTSPCSSLMPPEYVDQHTSSSTSNTHFTFPPPINNSYSHRTSRHDEMKSTLARYIPPYKQIESIDSQHLDEATYNSASHVITHLVRDWTASGRTIRADTYDWILDQLFRLHENCNSIDENLEPDPSHCGRQKSVSPVLVPGAGMARLAFDIAFARGDRSEPNNKQYYPFDVEAVDNSIVMAAAAHHILHNNFTDHDRQEYVEVFPFVADPLTNEVHSQQRWQSEIFPEDVVSQKIHQLHDKQQSSNDHRPNLSYIIGDFVSLYTSPDRHAMFGSIATCFFIDTATNIYEYILAIRNLLRVGGVWINVGPVQWHQNAQLQPSVDELKEIISLSGFEIRYWEMSEKLGAYRHPDDILIGTRAEAYRPLKFVVVLQPNNITPGEIKWNVDEEDLNLHSSIEKLRQATGRKSMLHNIKINET